jgi:hypothetical protein
MIGHDFQMRINEMPIARHCLPPVHVLHEFASPHAESVEAAVSAAIFLKQASGKELSPARNLAGDILR